ncbi:MAG: sugar phosphate isomerase/epimerase [Ruminococcaceae bacterium]|nr:sugar phosphate isomerase/epimerase [Oscillospiraceae bacterium]
MKLGITSGYFTKYGIEAGAKRLKAHGYDCADYQSFINTETDFFKLPEADFKKRLLEEKKIVEDAGIFIHQTHGPWRYPPKDNTEADRAERFDSMSKAIRGTAYLGCDKFIIHPIMPFGGNTSEQPDAVKAINFEFMSRLTEVAKEYGVIICYENMPFPLLPITTSKHVTDLARKIGSDNFKVCLDTGHCLVCGESPADAVRYIGKDLLCAMHVHDNDGKSDKHLIPGEGIADWDAFADALYDIGFDGVFSLETEIPTGNPADEQERLERGLALLGKKLARI